MKVAKAVILLLSLCCLCHGDIIQTIWINTGNCEGCGMNTDLGKLSVKVLYCLPI